MAGRRSELKVKIVPELGALCLGQGSDGKLHLVNGGVLRKPTGLLKLGNDMELGGVEREHKDVKLGFILGFLVLVPTMDMSRAFADRLKGLVVVDKRLFIHVFECGGGFSDCAGEVEAADDAVLSDNISDSLANGLTRMQLFGFCSLNGLFSFEAFSAAKSLSDLPLFTEGAIGQGTWWDLESFGDLHQG